MDWFWRLRGWLDELRGGDGMRRGRRDPHAIHVGDRIDFWRVERVEPDRRLLLAAEMKIPGRLWLQFDVEGDDRRTEIRQTTVFDPAGLVGLVYWYLLYPVHHTIFKAMLRGLNRATQPDPDGADATETSARQDKLQNVVDVGKDRKSTASSLLHPRTNPALQLLRRRSG